MRLLKDVWAEQKIQGKFKGSLDDFLFHSLEEGEVYDGPRLVKSSFEAMALDPKKLFLASKDVLKPESKVKKAGVVADLIFTPNQTNLECPHCKMAMKKVNLASGLGAVFCPSCRHSDYEDRVKSSIHAGSPSTDKSLQLKFTDSGNCQIV